MRPFHLQILAIFFLLFAILQGLDRIKDRAEKPESKAGTIRFIGVVQIKGKPWIFSEMPCGNHVELYPGQSMPTKDIPCPCGNPNHWLWKFIEPVK